MGTVEDEVSGHGGWLLPRSLDCFLRRCSFALEAQEHKITNKYRSEVDGSSWYSIRYVRRRGSQ